MGLGHNGDSGLFYKHICGTGDVPWVCFLYVNNKREVDFMDNILRYKKLKKVSLVTIAVNVVLSIAKLVVGIIAKSTAVISDAVHSISDIITTVMVMIGLKLSSKNADIEHPYGHHRIESLFSLALGTALGATALFLGYEGITKATSGTTLTLSPLAFVVTVVSIISKEWMFWYTRGVALKLNSSSLMSDAWHHRTDSISSIAVLIGLFFSYFGVGIADPIAAVVVCFIILKASYDIIKTAVHQLIDRSAPIEIEDRIRELVLGNSEVLDICELKTRISNNVIFADLTIDVRSDMTVTQSHDIAQGLSNKIISAGLNVLDCMVHIHPSQDECHTDET